MQRDKKWDFLKGFLIFSIIWGHTITVLSCGTMGNLWIYLFLRAFDLPMFSFISGYFLYASCQNRCWYLNIANKVCTLAFPILLWSTIYNLIFHESLSRLGHFWFLCAIFIVSLLMILIDLLGKNSKWLKLALFSLSVLLFHTVIQDSWKTGFILFFAAIGYYFAEYKSIITGWKYKNITGMLCMFLFLIGQFFWSGSYDIWTTGCNIFAFCTPITTSLRIVFRGALGIAGIGTVLFLSSFLFQKTEILERKSGLLWSFFGQHTLQLYILQSFVVEKLGRMGMQLLSTITATNPFTKTRLLLGYLIAPTFSLLVLCLLSLLLLVTEKMPLIRSFLWGIDPRKIGWVQKHFSKES